jgi:putative spermidine/putrescine transport system substrate-binding protein
MALRICLCGGQISSPRDGLIEAFGHSLRSFTPPIWTGNPADEATMTDHGLIAKLRSVRVSRRALAAGAAATLAARQGWSARAQESPAVVYEGETFDASGTILRVASWGGSWQEMERKYLIDQFQKDFNCTVENSSASPWFPKFIAGGVDNPPFDVTTWNQPELFRAAKAGAAQGGFFVPIADVRANVPNSVDLWDVGYEFGHGMVYLFSQLGYGYRTDTGEPPTSFASFWEDRYADKRGTYITANTLQTLFFIVASAVYGSGEDDLEAGYEAMRNAIPLKIGDFTSHMQTLLERGEVDICVQHDGEVFSQMDRAIPVDFLSWQERKPIHPQILTVSQGSSDVQKRLAYAYVNRACSAEIQELYAAELYLHPTNKNAVIPENLASKGVANDAAGVEGVWNPDWDWYLENEQEIVETVNAIFGLA